MRAEDLAWLAGLLEGEGSFLKAPPSSPNCPRISLEMTDKDVVERAASLMNGKVATRAVELMRVLHPEMGSRRRSQIDAALETYIERRRGDNTRRLSEDQVRQIREHNCSSISSLAREFGVSRFTIRNIRERKSWLHIQ